MYLSQRRGGDRDTNTTFHLPFASKIKFSSRVHLLNKIGKKNNIEILFQLKRLENYLTFELAKYNLASYKT